MKRSDLIAGLSVASLLLPEAVAYAAIAGLPPQRAIFAGIAGCLTYGLIGQSRFAVVSPTSSSAAILAAMLATLPGAAEEKAAVATIAILLAGLFFAFASVARLGNLTGLIARPVLRGFAFGLALTIIIKQLPSLTGLTSKGGSILNVLEQLAQQASQINSYSIGAGVVALGLLFAVKRYPALPGAFITLALGVAATFALDLTGHGVAVVGTIDRSLSWPSLPAFDFDLWSRLAQLALPLGLILFAESWGTVSALALRNGDVLDPNRELAALGVANFASAAVQGMPVGAGFSAASASEAAGAASKWTAIIAAAGLALLLAFATPLVAAVPEPVLAAVVIAALSHALNPAPFVRLAQLRRDLFLSLAAAAAVLAFGVLDGMLIAIGLSLAMLIQKLAHPRVVRLGQLGDSRDYVDISRHETARELPGLAVWRPSVPLLFANADGIFRFIQNETLQHPELHAVIVSLEETFDLDSTSLEVITGFDASITLSGKRLFLARVHDHVRDALALAKLQSLLGRCTYSVDDAVSQAQRPS